MTACFVPDCNHRPGVNKCSFHTFPKTTSVRRRWIQNIRRGDRRPNQNSRVCSCHFTKGLQKGPIWFPSRVKGIPPVEEDMVEEEEEEEDDRPRVASQTQTFYSPRVEHQAASGGVDRPASAAQQQQQDQRMVIVHQDQGPATGQLQVIPQGVTVIPSPGQQIMEVTLPDGQTQSCLFSPTAIPASSTATTIDDAGRPHSATRTPLQGDPDPTVDDAGRNWTLTPIEKDPDPTDPLQCVQCCITFSDAKGKMRHIRKSHREEYIQQIEQADTIFSCYVCERSFQSSSALCAHQYTHSSEDKRYKCDGCNEVFYFFSELTTHRRRACHSREEKLHKCDSCNEGFYSLAELTTHRRQVCPSIKRRPKKTPPSALPQGQSEPSALPHGQEPSALPEGQSAPTDSVLT